MKKILVISFALVLCACSSLNFQDSGTKLAIQYGVGKFIESGESFPDRARAIQEEVDEVRTFLDLQAFPVSEIKSRLIERIKDKGLSPADTMLATTLINLVEEEIVADIDAGIISEDDVIRINTVLDIVSDVAGLYL